MSSNSEPLSVSSQANIIDLSAGEFCQQSEPPLLIDVRSSLEFRLFHAPSAKNLSLQRLMLSQIPGLGRWLLPEWFQALPKTQPIAVVCLTSHRSPIVATQLVKQGYEQVYNISGGMMAWKQAQLPTVSGPSAE